MVLRFPLQLKSPKLEVCRPSYDQHKNTSFREIWTSLPLKYLHVSLHKFWSLLKDNSNPNQNKIKANFKPSSNQQKQNKEGENYDSFITLIFSNTSTKLSFFLTLFLTYTIIISRDEEKQTKSWLFFSSSNL